jgi:DNA-binding NarL/FixJ family response regulator
VQAVPKRLLVVDDHPAVALALKVTLRADNRFEVADSARTAAEGLRLLGQQDAVLLDLHLPDLSGPALVRAFRDRDPSGTLILYTAADDTPEVEAVRHLVDAVALKNGFTDVIAALERLIDR